MIVSALVLSKCHKHIFTIQTDIHAVYVYVFGGVCGVKELLYDSDRESLRLCVGFTSVFVVAACH